jgi:hypothetical protein
MAGITYGPSTLDKIGSLTSIVAGITGKGTGKAAELGKSLRDLFGVVGGQNLTAEQAAAIDEYVNNLEFDEN